MANARLTIALCAVSLGLAPRLPAQSGFDFTYGRWFPDPGFTTYAGGYHAPFLGPFDYGLGLYHQHERAVPSDRTLTGGVVTLGLGRQRSGWYGTGSVGLGMRHRDGTFDAHWTMGLGYARRLLPFLAVGLEAQYRVEDQDARGFWRLRPDDRRGLAVQLRVATGGRRRSTPPRAPRPTFRPPAESEIAALARESGSSADAASVAARVVRTAIDVMGTPYAWGGSDADGYDCSGLIQHAYAQQGVLLPRVSRDQIRMGAAVEPRLATLRPGDILGFSVERAGVTHVGLYVGDGQFIHSASGGVTLSSLTAADPDSQWWQRRLVTARRILQ